MSDEATITIELTEHETRALVRCAELISYVCSSNRTAGEVVALDSGAMKLSLALVLVGAQP